MIFPRACALADVAWAGHAVTGDADPADADAGLPSDLTARLTAHLRRLDAAGLDYRPLDGPRPWQEGGSGSRRHRTGARIQDVAVHLDELAAADENAAAEGA
jgi:hexosaminidase